MTARQSPVGGSGAGIGRERRWWVAPLVVTVVSLPLLFVLNVYLWAELWYGGCEPDDNSCYGPYTEGDERRAVLVSSAAALVTVSALAAVWFLSRGAGPAGRARRRWACAVLLAVQVAFVLALRR